MPSLDFEAIGTWWRIDSDVPLNDDVQKALYERIEEFDKTYSRFRSDSLVAQIAKKAGQYTFPRDAQRLFAFYRLLYEVSDGKVTPLIGGLLEAAGYDAAYTLQPEETLPAVVDWKQVMWWNGETLFTHMPVKLDVGAAGKGYLVDILAELCDELEVGQYVIDASGDILHNRDEAERVGLENPLDSTQVIGVADLRRKSLAASATNRRAWGEGMNHVFNPHTATPVKDVIATWVVADTTIAADGLATALFLCDPKKLQETFAFEYVRMFQNGRVEHSAGFEGEIFA